MSLQIYIDNGKEGQPILTDGIEVVWDVEAAFSMLPEIPDTPVVRELIKTIDEGEYTDGHHFKDRFGVSLYLSCLSTGCKAAICAYCKPSSIIDTLECGCNAVGALICNVTSGNIIIHFPCGMPTSGSTIDVECNGYHFTDGTKFWRYIEDEYPYPPGYFET